MSGTKPSKIGIGRVEAGQVVFPEWKGGADRPSPPLPAYMPPGERAGLAIAGLGRLSLEQIMPAFGEAKEARIAAAIPNTPDKAQAVAAQHGVRPQGMARTGKAITSPTIGGLDAFHGPALEGHPAQLNPTSRPTG